MTPLSLELIDITKDWVFSFVMLCQTFTAVVDCLWVFLSLVLSSASEMHAQSGWNQEIDRKFHFFTFKNAWVAFAVCFGSFPFVLWSAIQLTLLHLAESGQTVYPCIRIHPASSVTSLNTSNPVPLEAMHAHAITLLHHVSQMMLYALDHELFQAFSILFSSRHSGAGWT